MRYLDYSEAISIIGATDSNSTRLILDTAEAVVLNETGLTFGTKKTITLNGPVSQINLEPYLIKIESFKINSTEIQMYQHNLETGIINVSLAQDETATIIFWGTIERELIRYPAPSNYLELPDYPVKYIVSIKDVNGQSISEYALINEQILIVNEGVYDIKYRAGTALDSALKYAILNTAKYWYKLYAENLSNISTYKIGDESAKFFEGAIPLEAKMIIDQYRRKKYIYFGGIV